ncbi:uncharacterized protein ACA1_034610 [Acanthamoeba castellanii str. Neff]|uniref:Countin family protein n=2 Tax=Acanthamoeba castellanii (strain ATCC 30010 / Neff) TaxID=1257118 RepID=L8HE27_ACACF|nr:uncharacterized protein ACA1_034610 [Acanthamoeba castellanii str. Neff]ELR22616.1 hypothetical protein ACA1_034610 [Acanthamoeba castellanii str. Neff]
MRSVLALFALLALAAVAQASLIPSSPVLTSKALQRPAADPEWCPTCVSFMDQSIDQLLNIIANGGVLGGCNTLCGYLNQQLEEVVCNLLCDYVGIQAFIKLVDTIDPDSIYICEELTVCPISRNASASFKQLSVSPSRGSQGTTFVVEALFQVNNTIGTGELDVVGGTLLVNVKPGVYGAKFEVQTQPSEQEPFSPGQYIVQAAVCEGTCGSSHPYTKTLTKAQTSFYITQ